MEKSNIIKSFDFVLLTILLISLTIIPLIKINESLYIGVEEFLIPIILIRVYLTKSFFFNRYILLMIIFVVYIFFTILINNRLSSLRDYFELYKIGKFVIVVFFSIHILRNNIKNIDIVIYVIFVILLLFNLTHYFDILQFNSIIEPYYATNEIQLEFFGLDSLGNPAVKRMLGTMGNPNNNGILFLFFFSYFLSRSNRSLYSVNNIFLHFSFLFILLTQSRTAFLSTLLIYAFWFIFTNQKLKAVAQDILLFATCFFIALSFDALSLNYFSNTIDTMAIDGYEGMYKNRSVMGRMEVWEHLWNMIIHKPLFGYGPNKDYFYQNSLYAESEYVLYLWRYGIIGIILYFSWVLLPLYNKLKFIKKDTFFVLTIIIILVNAISNCPLTNPRILLLFALTAGYWFAFIEKQESNV